MKRQNYILGGGIAGLIAAEILRHQDFKVLESNTPGGQMANPWPLGPRIFHKTPEIIEFLKSIDFSDSDIISRPYIVGYKVGSGVSLSLPNSEYRAKYVEKTRPYTVADNRSYMSEGLNRFEGIEAPSIEAVVRRLSERITIRNQIIKEKVFSVDPAQKWVSTNVQNISFYEYDKLISTIPLKLLISLARNFTEDSYVEMYKYEELSDGYKINDKTFFYVDHESQLLNDCKNKTKIDYFYSIDDCYTRVTLVREGKAVIETIENNSSVIESILSDPFLNIQSIIDTKTIPVQIQRNIGATKFSGIHLLGRFAQWDHDVLTHDIIKRAMKLRKAFE